MREGLRFAATPDVMPLHEAEALARVLARFAPTDDAERLLAQRAGEARAGQDFLDAYGDCGRPHVGPHHRVGPGHPAERLKVPIGKTPNGQVVFLDLKEGAENGVGPHGSMTGQTGSGKSEHCISLVLGVGGEVSAGDGADPAGRLQGGVGFCWPGGLAACAGYGVELGEVGAQAGSF